MSERETHPGTGRLHLRDAVLEAALRLATGHEKVAMPEPKRARPPTSVWAQQERTSLTERHEGHDGIHDLRRYAVAVPQRPGHGETGGPYYEAQGGCANADFAKAGHGAAASIEAAVDYLSRQAFVRKTGTVAFGHSAGGWGALALATHSLRPLAGVVAFAPGLGGRIDDVAGKNCAPDRLIAGRRVRDALTQVDAIGVEKLPPRP